MGVSPVHFCVVCAELLPEDSVPPRRGQKAALSLRPTSKLHLLHLDSDLQVRKKSQHRNEVDQNANERVRKETLALPAAAAEEHPVLTGWRDGRTLLVDWLRERPGA